MSGEMILALIAAIVSLLTAALAFITNRRANRTVEKKTEYEGEDLVAKRRLGELERLYDRVDKLEKIVADLQKADRDKQATIDEQARELDHTNQKLDRVRRLFSDFVARVETAWVDGHTMPILTPDEREVLESTIPRAPRGSWRNHE